MVFTDITLDTTEDGRSLYEKCGFVSSSKSMILHLN